jgi:hypothetical protein
MTSRPNTSSIAAKASSTARTAGGSRVVNIATIARLNAVSIAATTPQPCCVGVP